MLFCTSQFKRDCVPNEQQMKQRKEIHICWCLPPRTFCSFSHKVRGSEIRTGSAEEELDREELIEEVDREAPIRVFWRQR